MSIWNTAAKVVSPAYALGSSSAARGFFETLTGRTSERAAQQLGERNAQQIGSGYDTANQQARTGYDTGMALWQPWADAGRRGQTAYENTLGINGRDAAQRQFQQSYLDDPALAYRNDANTQAMQALYRKYNAGPQGINSGAALLGAGRLRSEQFNNDWGGVQNRLMGLGQQGMQATGQQSGLTSNYYDNSANRAIGRSRDIVQNQTQATMAANNARSAGVNNLLSLAGNLGGSMFRLAGMPGSGRG